MSPDGTHVVHPRGQLFEVVLGRVEFERDFAFAFEHGTPSYVVNTALEARVSDDRSTATVDLDATIEWIDKPADQPRAPFRLSIQVTAVFEWMAPELADEEIKGWLEFNGEHLLWPYLRSYVSNLTLASGLPPMTIYTITPPRPRVDTTSADDAGVDAPVV